MVHFYAYNASLQPMRKNITMFNNFVAAASTQISYDLQQIIIKKPLQLQIAGPKEKIVSKSISDHTR